MRALLLWESTMLLLGDLYTYAMTETCDEMRVACQPHRPMLCIYYTFFCAIIRFDYALMCLWMEVC